MGGIFFINKAIVPTTANKVYPCDLLLFPIIVGLLEAAYSLNLGAWDIWGKSGGETLALLW